MDGEQTPSRESPVTVKNKSLPMILLSNREAGGVFPLFNSSLDNEQILPATEMSRALVDGSSLC